MVQLPGLKCNKDPNVAVRKAAQAISKVSPDVWAAIRSLSVDVPIWAIIAEAIFTLKQLSLSAIEGTPPLTVMTEASNPAWNFFRSVKIKGS